MEDTPSDMKEIMGPNEQVELYIKQKIYHPKISIDSVVITNERVILRHPHALNLKKDYTDFNYQDISNVILDKGILRSSVKFTLRLGGEPMVLNDLPSDQAERAYGIIRENLVRFQAPFSTGMAGVPPFAGGGTSPLAQGRACPRCGAPVSAGQRFCGSCGAPMQ